jgi:AcrR family transcriptional regulator
VQATARSARDGILATADRLFYHHGIQAVGVQRLLEESDVTRVTFYRHFPSKDDLVLAYLDRRGPPRALLALRTGYVSLLGWRRTPAGPNSSWPPTTGSSASAERYPRRLARWLCSCRSMP